jgi:chromosome segregation ATPase
MTDPIESLITGEHERQERAWKEHTDREDLLDRLSDEADLCRNDGADDIANLLSAAREEILRLEGRVNHLTNVNDGLRETIDDLRTGLAELKAMCAPEQSA